MNIVSLYPCPFDVQDRHDIGTAICKGAQLYAYEEDKLTTVKQEPTAKFPERSLFYGLRELGLEVGDIDLWVFPTPARGPNLDDLHFFFSTIVKAFTGSRADFEEWVRPRVAYVPHHLAHVALATLTSEFDECPFLSMDGGGDGGDLRNMVYGVFREDAFAVLGEARGRMNVAVFHAFLTDAIGILGDNYKTTGLAAYGRVSSELYRELRELFTRDGAGWSFHRKRYVLSPHAVTSVKADAYRRLKILNSVPSDTNVFRLTRCFLPHVVAATGEQLVQDLVLDVVAEVRAEAGADRLVLSGGLFQNVAVNRRIVDSGLFRQVHVPMAPSDAGLSLGQLLFELHRRGEMTRRDRKLSPFLGPSFSEAEYESLLRETRIVYHRPDDVIDWVLERLLAGQVVGWFQGRGEYGPRSLGNRSILADPRNAEAKARVNQLLKKRDWFMPFAPAVLDEHGPEWFKGFFESPYMQFTFEVLPGKVHQIPAAVHVDRTSRIQTVSARTNPGFHRLITRFYERTGVPMVLNTSFNRHGIATISAPRQALDHFLEGCVDALAIGPFGMDVQENRRLAPLTAGAESSEAILLAQHCVRHLRQLLSRGFEDVPWDEVVGQLREEFALPLELPGHPPVVRLGDVSYPLSSDGLQNLARDLPGIFETLASVRSST